MADLVADALAWVDEVHPHARHLAHTLDWLLVLDPHAGEALQIAAVAHDVERAFPAPAGSPRGTDDPTSSVYERWHQDRSAQIISDWLHERGAEDPLIDQVRALVRVHEDGGSPEADLLQAADSLSFLEVQVEHFAGLVAGGELSPAHADEKLRRMYDRIAPGRARELAAPMLAAALARIATVEAPAAGRGGAGA